MYDKRRNQLTAFDKSKGLVSNVFHIGAFTNSRTGYVIYGTHEGVVAFRPADVGVNEY